MKPPSATSPTLDTPVHSFCRDVTNLHFQTDKPVFDGADEALLGVGVAGWDVPDDEHQVEGEPLFAGQIRVASTDITLKQIRSDQIRVASTERLH